MAIALVREGNKDAFADIIGHYQIPIIRYLYHLTGDHNVAQDLAQDTFLNAYRGILKTNSNLSLKAWLYRIAANNAKQYQRRERLLTFIRFADWRGDHRSPEEPFHNHVEMQMLVEEALTKVPYAQRQCLVLHFMEDFKYREIAEILGISEEAVRKRVARGSEVFQTYYRLYGEEEK